MTDLEIKDIDFVRDETQGSTTNFDSKFERCGSNGSHIHEKIISEEGSSRNFEPKIVGINFEPKIVGRKDDESSFKSDESPEIFDSKILNQNCREIEKDPFDFRNFNDNIDSQNIKDTKMMNHEFLSRSQSSDSDEDYDSVLNNNFREPLLLKSQDKSINFESKIVGKDLKDEYTRDSDADFDSKSRDKSDTATQRMTKSFSSKTFESNDSRKKDDESSFLPGSSFLLMDNDLIIDKILINLPSPIITLEKIKQRSINKLEINAKKIVKEIWDGINKEEDFVYSFEYTIDKELVDRMDSIHKNNLKTTLLSFFEHHGYTTSWYKNNKKSILRIILSW